MTTDVGALQLLDGVEDAYPAGGCGFAPRGYHPRADSRTDHWAEPPADSWPDSQPGSRPGSRPGSWTGSWTGSCQDARV
ncbi:hypothetical protein CFP65_1436 [Kitasatospora sp. MMS16-BH015]|uniref:hypothetical protein n=1 Tax=Kitasatospora sp. MMS16-BH015 TaxID=2018025 RepID=UPI000CA15B39|nr:hypothetical protein [Kitasatospora sp. MMS16-BH015]AUG76334.1 hypothetical protein CFP65_1436 [Kitasatospora sp. MMS16-BH015]